MLELLLILAAASMRRPETNPETDIAGVWIKPVYDDEGALRGIFVKPSRRSS